MDLQQIVTILFEALTNASILALVTLAIVLIFRTSFTTNFAQGSIATFSAYAVTSLLTKFFLVQFPSSNPTILLIISILISVVIGFTLGLIIDVFIIRKSKFSNPITKQMITMGMILIISGLIPIFYGIEVLPVPRRLSTTVLEWNVGGDIPVYMPVHNLISIAISIIIVAAVFIALKKTKWGLGVRATASNETVAGMMGVNTKFITAMSWGIAGGIGAIASALYAPMVFGISIDMMIPLQINGFLSGVLGGFSTFGGPIFAAVIIPLARALSYRFISNTWANAIVYILIIVVILIKPIGLFGKRIIKKV